VGRVFADLYAFLTLFLPWKVVVAVGVTLAVLALPSWMETVRERQLRGQVRRMVRAEQSERAALVERSMTLAGERPSRLARLVEAGRHYDQRDLVDRALGRLEVVDPREAARLRSLGAPPKPRARDPLEVVVRVESLLASGMTSRAREVLDEGLREHPADAELVALRSRIGGDGA
jgi:hypothetical protein